MPKAIVIGATSGIGKALVHVLVQHGFDVGATGRRLSLLEGMQSEPNAPGYIKSMDVTRVDEAMQALDEMIAQMGDVDLIVISAGVGFINPHLDWEKERDTINTNVRGFAAIANVAFQHFIKQGKGHLVGISSVAAVRGSGAAPAYNASKAFVSSYLEGLRLNAAKQRLPISVTDVRPGFVDTAMAQGDGLFWVATPEIAARQIFSAIAKKKKVVYVTRRWRLIAWLMRLLPEAIYKRI